MAAAIGAGQCTSQVTPGVTSNQTGSESGESLKQNPNFRKALQMLSVRKLMPALRAAASKANSSTGPADYSDGGSTLQKYGKQLHKMGLDPENKLSDQELAMQFAQATRDAANGGADATRTNKTNNSGGGFDSKSPAVGVSPQNTVLMGKPGSGLVSPGGGKAGVGCGPGNVQLKPPPTSVNGKSGGAEIKAPTVDTPKLDGSKIDIPKVDVSKIELPKINLPKLDGLKGATAGGTQGLKDAGAAAGDGVKTAAQKMLSMFQK